MKQLGSGFLRPAVSRAILLSGLALIIILTVAPLKSLADSFVQSFSAGSSLQPGWIVAISTSNTNSVIASPGNDSARMYGVVIDPSEAPITVQRQGQQVFVTNNGDYPVLVSNQNGVIKSGDYVSISSISGIGAKATPTDDSVLGQALQSFDGKSNVITSDNGVNIGRITVYVNPQRNPLLQTSAAIPGPLRNLSQSIAGKPVSALHIYGALAIFLVTAIISASLLWVGVRSGMIAIGRNPLSRHSIVQSLSQVVVMSVLIFIAGLFGVYLLLRL